MHFYFKALPSHRLAFPRPPRSRGLSRGLRNAALWRSLRHCVPPPCSSVPDGAPDCIFFEKCNKKTRCNFLQRVLWCTISGRVKNSVLSACRPVRPPFCFAKPLVRLYAARGVHCSLPVFAHAQSWPLLTNPQPFLAPSPRELNASRRRSMKPSRREWCNKKAATSVAAFLGAPSGTLPRAKERRTVAFLTALRAAALFEYPRRCTRLHLL